MTTVINEQSDVNRGHVGPAVTDGLLHELTRHAPWEVWAEKLASRKQPLPLQKLLPAPKRCPLLWSTCSATHAETRELLDELYSLRRRVHRRESPTDWNSVVTRWLDAHPVQIRTSDEALTCIAWTHALPRLAVRTDAEVWTALFARLINEAADASSSQALPMDIEQSSAHQILVSQLAAVELPLTLAYTFPKIDLCQQLAESGRQTLAEGLIALLDGEGIPHARIDTLWSALLGCWTRCLHLDRRIKGGRLDKEARLQFEWLVRQTIRWSRSDGSLLLGDSQSDQHGLIESALEVGGDAVDRELAKIQSGGLTEDDSEYALPPAGEHSEWAEVAVLRSSWMRRATTLAVNYGQGPCFSELQMGGATLWSGRMMPSLAVNGQSLVTSGEWEEVCWFSDDDVDYLELEIALSAGWKLQRQFLLSREDEFVFLADAFIGEQAGEIAYRLEIPTDPSIDWVAEEETTELQILGSKTLGWALPLGLSEWQVERRAGTYTGRALAMNQQGKALYAPLFLDLAASRRRKLRTWRQLTVAESLEIMSRDVAVAFRVMSGTQQWAFYRSLGPAGNRTFLGQNTTSEFVAGRFDEDGELDNLIEIE
jgi:hypothetical protein